MHINQKNDEIPAFELHVPRVQSAPFVLNSPHSGRCYPASFLEKSRLTAHSIRSSEDFHVDKLIEGGRELGLPLLAANFPRAYLDVNREPFELDPLIFDEPLPDFANTQSHRVTSGLGTIARIVAEGQHIYQGKITLRDALLRIEKLYKPYHNALRRQLTGTQAQFGFAVLIDCHSMPSSSTGLSIGQRPDLILGDRFGSSCSPQLLYNARTIFENMGYKVDDKPPLCRWFYHRTLRQT